MIVAKGPVARREKLVNCSVWFRLFCVNAAIVLMQRVGAFVSSGDSKKCRSYYFAAEQCKIFKNWKACDAVARQSVKGQLSLGGTTGLIRDRAIAGRRAFRAMPVAANKSRGDGMFENHLFQGAALENHTVFVKRAHPTGEFDPIEQVHGDVRPGPQGRVKKGLLKIADRHKDFRRRARPPPAAPGTVLDRA